MVVSKVNRGMYLLKITLQNSQSQSLNRICKDIPNYTDKTGHSGTYLV